MARRTSPSADDWHNVEDAKARKKIQDRLAQRARRQRLREAKNNAKPGSQQGETRRGVDAQHRDERPSDSVVTAATCWRSTAGVLEMVPLRPDAEIRSSFSSASPPTNFEDSCPVGFSDGTVPRFEDFLPVDLADVAIPSTLVNPIPSADCGPITPENPLTIYGALYINGMYLKIPCSTVVPAKSDPVGPTVPASLRPTELQLITIHPRWIDRFPFPKMRDSLISLSGVIDHEEFLRDLALMPSFDIVPGRAPWDPSAWKVKKPFADKWGYLFFCV